MRRKREIFIGIVLLLISTLAYIFGWTNVFTVKAVAVTGSPNTEITKQVLLISDIRIGEKLARIEPRNISTKLALSGIDWIESVKISRNWINRKVTIDLSARVPVAKSGQNYVDQSGVLFTSPVSIKAKLPELSAADSTARGAAIGLYLALPEEMKSEVTEIRASASSNFQLILNQKLRINWGGNSNNQVKVKIYKALIALPENKELKSMDLSDPIKPTVK